jgi:glycosyltransferase involved in cell wall biosynthesis
LSSNNLLLVSIVTPVFNGARFIEELILSVQSQDYPCIEHIVIDDGSTDGTVEILKKYPHLHWWSRENRGQYATMNEGLDAAKGEMVCFVSADDVLASGAVHRVMEFVQANPDCDGVYGFTAFMRENGEPYLPVTPFRYLPLKYYAYLWHVSHCSLYIKRDVLLINTLYFDPSLHYVGDYDWIIRLINKSIKINMLRESLSQVRIHDDQTSIQRRDKMRLEQELIAKKNGINPLLYSFTIIVTTWVFNFYKLFFTFKQAGLNGCVELIRNWQRKQGHPVN